jgi:cytochrome c biogenesis protein CcmG/thiol:disulfide interchange protein DsbE
VLIGSAIGLVLGVALFVGLRPSPNANSGSGSGPVVGVGSVAPTFSLSSLTGGAPVDLDLLGKDRHRPVILNFFASWCGPCQEETPLLARTAAAEMAMGSDIQFVGVDSLDPRSDALAFVKKAGITYPVGSDGGQVSSGLYALEGFPQTFFISPEGKVLGVQRGKVTPALLQHWIHQLGQTPG